VLDGTVGDAVPNPSVNVGQLQDGAYTYTGADIVVYDYGIHIDDYVTIVIIDDGLRPEEWKALEQNPEANVDIIGFVTETSEGVIKYITDSDDEFIANQVAWGHGFAVISALATVARDVKVIFADMKLYSAEAFGFEELEYSLWKWIDDNQAARDIDIVSLSYSTNITFNTQPIRNRWKNLNNDDVILISSAGNYGTYYNENGTTDEYWRYPQYYKRWYCVGSIDHETRSVDNSTKNQKTYYSAWYKDTTVNNNIVNWLEPGHGVSVLIEAKKVGSIYKGTWVYGNGTSVSAPYLAAIVALIITGYHDGIGDSTDPSLDKVIEILQYASSRSTFDQKMGYGFVDAYIAYGKAYTEGILAS
jgi:hypothetical protein